MAAYNGEKYIKAQIDSILNQSYPNVELYVRDDGSKDGTLAIVREYEEKGLLHLEAGENVGFVKALNGSLQMAAKQIIMLSVTRMMSGLKTRLRWQWKN